MTSSQNTKSNNTDKQKQFDNFEEDKMSSQQFTKDIMDTLKFYWSGGLLGEDLIGSVKPDSWDEELEKAQED